MAKYTEERMFGMLTDINRSEKRNAYKKYDLPKYKDEELLKYPDGGGIGTFNYSPYALNTFSPLVSNPVYNPSQLLSYTRPHLASNPGQGIFRTPLEISVGLPYDRSVYGLTNPALNIPQMRPMSYNDYTYAQGMNNPTMSQYQAIADFYGKNVNSLTEQDLNAYAAQKTLGEIKPKYTAGKPIDVGLRYSIQGMPQDQNANLRGGLSFNAGYNAQSGFFGGVDAGGYGLFGNVQPGKYLKNGLTKANEFMVTPSLNLAMGLRQRSGYMPDQEKVDTYQEMLALDAANGTDFAVDYYKDELDHDIENLNWAIKPEIKVEYKPFRNIPVNLEGVLGANIDLAGDRAGQMDQLIPGVAPYGKISAVVPINQAKKAINKLDLFDNGPVVRETEDEYKKRREEELIEEEKKKREEEEKQKKQNIRKGKPQDCPEGSYRKCYTVDEEGNAICPCEFEKSAHPRWLQFGGELDKFVGGGSPGDKYYKNNGDQYKKTSAGQWFVWNPTYNNWQYAENGFHNNVDLEKYKASYTPDDGSWDNDKPKSTVAKPGTVSYYEEQRNKAINNPFASYEQKMKATNAPLASNVPIRNELAAQKAAEDARIAAEKSKAEQIASWYEQEKEQRRQDALMFGNSPVQVADATRVDVGYLSPLVGESMRAEADQQRKEDEIFTTQQKVLNRGFKNIYDYENDPMGREWDLAQAYENAWRQSGEERPMMNTGEMGYNQGPENTKTGWDAETGKYYTATGVYDPVTRQFAPNPTRYKGSGAIQSVDAIWAAPIAIPAAIQGISSLGALGALEIPGMYGATLGNAVNAGFIGHGLYSLPSTAQAWNDAYKEGKGDYRDALEKTMWNTLDFAGLGEGAGLKSVAQDVRQAGKYITTKTPLKNTYKINPLAPKLGQYNRVVGQDAIDDIVESGLVRVNENAGVAENLGPFGMQTRTTPYPSFGKAEPQQAYIDQVIQQGKTPYVISTDRPMRASTLGRHGKGKTQFPVDDAGNYITGFPASEAQIFEGTPNWLTGYKPVSMEGANLGNLESTGVMASENSGMFKSATNTPDLKDYSRDTSKRYQRVSKQEMDDFLAQNPGKEVEVVKHDNWPGVLNSDGIAMNDPIGQTRALQKSEFDQATEFATKWAVKDPVAYQKVMDDIAFTQKRIDGLMNNGNNAMAEMYKLQRQWIDDYVRQNPGRTVSELEKEFNILKNTNQDFTKSEYYQVMTKALNQNAAASPEVRAIYDAATNLQNTVQRLNSQIGMLTKNTDSMMDPTFKEKVEAIYDAARRGQPSAGAVDINGRSTLVYGSQSEPSFLNLPQYEQQYLAENWNNIGGVRTGNKTITLGSRPEETVFFLEKPATAFKTIPYEKYPFSIGDPKTWKNALKKKETGYNTEVLPVDPADVKAVQIDKQTMVVPSTVGEIQAHEVGHDLQKFYDEWIKNLEEYRPDLQYSTGHSRNPLAEEFNKAMVNPTAPVPNPMKPGSTKQSTETWKSSVGELHSELMLARYKAAKHLMAKKYSDGITTMDEAIAAVKQLEKNGDEALLDFYLEDAGGNLTKHFKGETSDDMKKALIQILPAVVPAAVVGAGMMSGESGLPENRYGGNIKNLSKFIKK